VVRVFKGPIRELLVSFEKNLKAKCKNRENGKKGSEAHNKGKSGGRGKNSGERPRREKIMKPALGGEMRI